MRCVVTVPYNSNMVYIGTMKSGVWKSSNGGNNWFQASYGLTAMEVRYLVVDPSNPQTLYAATTGGGVYKSTDGAGSWQPCNIGLAELSIRSLAVDPAQPSVVYAGSGVMGGTGTVYKSMDGGQVWQPLMNGLVPTYIPCLALDPFNSATVFCGTANGVYRMTQVHTAVRRSESGQPVSFELQQNYPNPFNPTTAIVFTLNRPTDLNLVIYDLLGNQIRSLLSGKLSAGRHTAVWDGRDDSGRSVAAGVYFYRLVSSEFSATRTMILAK
ncbi:MAG: hypothetical protein BWY83_03058 [bacterium ADurb.Bin478]|nr:MAG: hypothetical protein BWY83_03058 [bacterium ADurb.Bin478]